MKSDFKDLSTVYVMILISFSRIYLHCLCEIISDILHHHWLINCRQLRENQFQLHQNEDILNGTDVSDRSLILRYLLLYLSPSSTLGTGSQFLEFVRPQGWLQFLQLWYHFLCVFLLWTACVFLWGILYYYSHSPLCSFLSFVCRWLYCFSRRINTKSFIFLVSLWFSSPASATCNLLCLSTKVLNPVASL